MLVAENLPHLPLLAEIVHDDMYNSYSVYLDLVPVEGVPVMAVALTFPSSLSFLLQNAHTHTETDVRTFPRAQWDLAGVHERTGRVGG